LFSLSCSNDKQPVALDETQSLSQHKAVRFLVESACKTSNENTSENKTSWQEMDISITATTLLGQIAGKRLVASKLVRKDMKIFTLFAQNPGECGRY
jgi:hypothetical protein